MTCTANLCCTAQSPQASDLLAATEKYITRGCPQHSARRRSGKTACRAMHVVPAKLGNANTEGNGRASATFREGCGFGGFQVRLPAATSGAGRGQHRSAGWQWPGRPAALDVPTRCHATLPGVPRPAARRPAPLAGLQPWCSQGVLAHLRPAAMALSALPCLNLGHRHRGEGAAVGAGFSMVLAALGRHRQVCTTKAASRA